MGERVEWTEFGSDDEVLDSRPFRQDEVRCNLMQLHRYIPEALRLKAADGSAALTWMPDRNGWMWFDSALEPEERRERIDALSDELDRRQIRLRGISGDPEDVRVFAAAYAERGGSEWGEHMELVAYACENVRAPSGVPGRARPTGSEDAPRIAEFLSGFVRDAFGEERAAEHFAESAAEMAVSGNVYFWEVDGVPSAMAQLASASKRHRRMNEVYTPSECRKRGYASAFLPYQH
ncbi:hypothetical protein CDO73_04710 [Saccharibacillus sp. O23]|uniref:hypothetical protein n=1 Tax=Saccharibacillus sp. O23 TaxID=2009338 RepID=UPI000B4E216A|nr:hypothetical protein [Saccharibacillus sp. O23]OWR31786.1 hypothetical protein CDO73_04710 [Saccharibacillus sp. O23]